MFSCELCEISKNTIFTEHLRWLLLIGDSRIGFCPGLLWKHELNLRSSHYSCSIKKGVLRNFANFTGKRQYWSLYLIVLQAKRLKHMRFPVEFMKFLKAEVYERLLLPSLLILLIQL